MEKKLLKIEGLSSAAEKYDFYIVWNTTETVLRENNLYPVCMYISIGSNRLKNFIASPDKPLLTEADEVCLCFTLKKQVDYMLYAIGRSIIKGGLSCHDILMEQYKNRFPEMI